MRPYLHASLVNGRFEDPAVYVETQFENRALLFDLGDISALTPRKIHHVDRVLVSHTHIDHFIGFDRLLRVLTGREKTVLLFGPPGFVAHVGHKLHAYRWNLARSYACDLVFSVTEIHPDGHLAHARFRLKTEFARETLDDGAIAGSVVETDPSYTISAALLEHRTPCMGYAIEEPAHVNVWKNRIEEMGLAVGPWLNDLKRLVLDGAAYDERIEASDPTAPSGVRECQLGDLRRALTVTKGQKIAYVTDVADTPANRDRIVALAHGADLLFIEATFSGADRDLAHERAHLTATAAGEIARAAGVRRVEPFHLSPRYAGEERRLLDEVDRAFRGLPVPAAP